MSHPKIFFFIISISLIICKDPTKTKKTKEQEPIKHINPNLTNQTATAFYNMPPPPEIPFNVSIDDMDKLMLCSVIVQESLKKKKTEIENVEKRLNLTKSNKVYDKIGTDIFEKCNKIIDMKLVNNYIKNLTYINGFKWEKDYDVFLEINFDKYEDEDDLKYTVEQEQLMNKFNKVNEIFRYKKMEERQNFLKERKKIKIGKVDLNNIPLSFKLGLFLVILLIFFGGIFYFLKTLNKKPKDKKKKEKKKKTQ